MNGKHDQQQTIPQCLKKLGGKARQDKVKRFRRLHLCACTIKGYAKGCKPVLGQPIPAPAKPQ